MNLEEAIGNVTLQLLDNVRRVMEAEGDEPDDYKVTGAYLFIVAENSDDVWYYSGALPNTIANRIGLATLAQSREVP